jgi:hypothetical protein
MKEKNSSETCDLKRGILLFSFIQFIFNLQKCKTLFWRHK